MYIFPIEAKKIKIVNANTAPIQGDVLLPFAYDEWQTRRTGEGDDPVIHLWRHEKAFILGLRDWKLPFAADAVRWLEAQGYRTAVRHSGGAAVPLDSGVLNVSLIIPKKDKSISFHQEFEAFYQWMQSIFQMANVAVMKGEVKGSYCPGDYDLAVNGLKFCGIAQRRQTKAVVIQAFINIKGSGRDRAGIVKRFYEKAVYGEDKSSSSSPLFPCIEERTVCSLEEVSSIESVPTIEELLIQSAKGMFHNVQFASCDYHSSDLNNMKDQLRRRYQSR
jgi:octanoyl-[GcvH]:protein N-octanoyltransferase